MALRCLPHLASRSDRHLQWGRQCGHETSHVVHQQCPPSTTTPSFRTLLIVPSLTLSMVASKTRSSNSSLFWLFFSLLTYGVFAPSSPWVQLRLSLLKSLFFAITSTYYLRFYDHIVGLVCITESVWQRFKTPNGPPCHIFKKGVKAALIVYTWAPPRTNIVMPGLSDRLEKSQTIWVSLHGPVESASQNPRLRPSSHNYKP